MSMERPTYGWNNFYTSVRASGFHLVFNVIIFVLFFLIDQTVDMVQQIETSGAGFRVELVGLFLSIVFFSFLSWSGLRMIFDLTTLSECEQTYDSTISYLTSPEDDDRSVYYGGKFGIAFPRCIAVVLPLFISLFSFIQGLTEVGTYTLAAAIFIFILLIIRNKLEIYGRQLLSHRWIFCFLLVSVVSLSIFAIVFSSVFTEVIYGLNLILVGLGSMLFGLTLATYLIFDLMRSRKKDSRMYGFVKRPYPILVFAIGVPLIVGAVPWSDNHQIRLTEEKTEVADGYATLDDAFETFKAQALDNGFTVKLTDGSTIVPVFFIASQGGGLRAAYWTSLALSQLEIHLPGFEHNIFALTGASGGSVGNAIYLASRQINDMQVSTLDCEASDYLRKLTLSDETLPTKRFCLLDKAAGKDYLSSVTTSFLYNDLLYSYLPIPIPIYSRDRAAYLELAFERGFENVYLSKVDNEEAKHAGLRQPYLNLYSDPDAPWQPILMGTTTVQELGMLALYAPFPIDSAAFSNKIDLSQYMSYPRGKAGQVDMRISTVALNSARFPYITPTGTLDVSKDRKDKLHLADAGYFDNYGASVTTDMISELFLSDAVDSTATLEEDKDAAPASELDDTIEATETSEPTETNVTSVPIETAEMVETDKTLKTAASEPIFLPIPVVLTNSLFEGASEKPSGEEIDNKVAPFDLAIPAIHKETKSWFAHEISSPLQALVSIRGGLANTMLHEMIEQQETFQAHINDVESETGNTEAAQLSRVLFNGQPLIVMDYKNYEIEDGSFEGTQTEKPSEESTGIDPPLGWWLSEKSKCKLSTRVFYFFESIDDTKNALLLCDAID